MSEFDHIIKHIACIDECDISELNSLYDSIMFAVENAHNVIFPRQSFRPLRIQLERGFLVQIILLIRGVKKTRNHATYSEDKKFLYDSTLSYLLFDEKNIRFDRPADEILFHQAQPYINNLLTTNYKQWIKLLFFRTIKIYYYLAKKPILFYYNHGKLADEIAKVKNRLNLGLLSISFRENKVLTQRFRAELIRNLNLIPKLENVEEFSELLTKKVAIDAQYFMLYRSSLKKIFDKHAHCRVISSSIGSPLDICALEVAKMSNIPTYYVQHGFSIASNRHIHELIDFHIKIDDVPTKQFGTKIIECSRPW